jgi:hypothetical protein
VALARLKVADHEKRLPSGGTSACSVQAAQLYMQAVEAGLIELASSSVVTTLSAAKAMSVTVLSDGRTFGDIRLTWSDIEELYVNIGHRVSPVEEASRQGEVVPPGALLFGRLAPSKSFT